MAVNKRNLRYCQVLYLGKYYDVMIAVAGLDEVDNILQEWAVNKFSTTLDLPSALIQNKDATEILKTIASDGFAYLQSPVASYMDMPRYAGISGDLPVFPTVLAEAGHYTVPTCLAFLWSEPEFMGYFGEYIIPVSQEFTLSIGINHIGISFNTGSPIYSLHNSFDDFNFSSVIPVVSVLYFGTETYNIPFGQTGYGLPEKILKNFNKKQKLSIVDNYTLITDNRYINLGELLVNVGVSNILCQAVDTEIIGNDMYLHYKDSSSVWQNTKVSQVDNQQYQSISSGLASLSAGEFVINNIFRVVDAGKTLIFSVLSNKFTTLQSALNSADITDLPPMFKGSAVLIGRVIIEKDATVPTIQTIQKISWGVN